MEVVNVIPGTSGMIAPMTILSCKSGSPVASTKMLAKDTNALVNTFFKKRENNYFYRRKG